MQAAFLGGFLYFIKHLFIQNKKPYQNFTNDTVLFYSLIKQHNNHIF